MKKILTYISIILFFCCDNDNKYNRNIHQGIKWGNNLDSALTIASESNKIIMIDFMAEWCPPCQKMEKETFPDLIFELIKVFVE